MDRQSVAPGGPGLFILTLTVATSLTRVVGKHLNLDLPANIFPRIAARLPAGPALEQARIMEDPTLYADCTGVA